VINQQLINIKSTFGTIYSICMFGCIHTLSTNYYTHLKSLNLDIKDIAELQKPDICVKMFDCYNVKSINAYFNDYIDINDIDDNAVIIYPEVINDNPLNKPNVVRWILAPVGMNCSSNIVDTWGKK
jgi:hypothetical protein